MECAPPCLEVQRRKSDPRTRTELLEAYVANYVSREVRIEADVRHLDALGRFLEVAAPANGQLTNVAGIARDAAVASCPSGALPRALRSTSSGPVPGAPSASR